MMVVYTIVVCQAVSCPVILERWQESTNSPPEDLSTAIAGDQTDPAAVMKCKAVQLTCLLEQVDCLHNHVQM